MRTAGKRGCNATQRRRGGRRNGKWLLGQHRAWGGSPGNVRSLHMPRRRSLAVSGACCWSDPCPLHRLGEVGAGSYTDWGRAGEPKPKLITFARRSSRFGRYLPCAARRISERSGHRSANVARMHITLLVHVLVLVMGSRGPLSEKVHRNGANVASSTSCRPSRHARRSALQSERHERKICVVSGLHWSIADRRELRREWARSGGPPRPLSWLAML